MIKISLKIFILFFLVNYNSFLQAKEAYFDLSENKIQIQTDFDGKEIIIFGLLKDDQETLITIKGPLKNSKIQKKERIFGLWFNAKQITYKNIPSIFFIASSNKVEDILPHSTIIKHELNFDYLLENKIYNRNFISDNNQKLWKNNFIRLKKEKGLFKFYKLKKVEEKLFQTRMFFPSNTLPGKYNVNIYHIYNNKIVSSDMKEIIIEKSGIGNKIYKFANNNSATYGLFTAIFAIICGIIAATIFRRL